MKSLVLTEDLYNWIRDECTKFQEATWDANYVDPNDILYSYLNSTDDVFHILNDWSEGKNNDPFWNDELNEHSAIVFIQEMVKKINDIQDTNVKFSV